MASAVPIAQADSLAQQDGQAQLAPAPQGCTVLVIEDDADVRSVIRRSLEDEGYVVLEAADGESGLDLIGAYAGPLDVVLTDLEMPRINGMAVAEVLGVFRPLLAVVCMSGGLSPIDLAERLSSTSVAFLAKPFSPEDLTRVVADALGRAQEVSALAEARQSVLRSFPVELKLTVAADLVASARRLESYHERRRYPR